MNGYHINFVTHRIGSGHQHLTHTWRSSTFGWYLLGVTWCGFSSLCMSTCTHSIKWRNYSPNINITSCVSYILLLLYLVFRTECRHSMHVTFGFIRRAFILREHENMTSATTTEGALEEEDNSYYCWNTNPDLHSLRLCHKQIVTHLPASK